MKELTVEIFKNCPKWAEWAAVDPDGSASFFVGRPSLAPHCWCFPKRFPFWKKIEGRFDASQWQCSRIQRPAAEGEHLSKEERKELSKLLHELWK